MGRASAASDHCRKRLRAGGFTLVEIVAVMALISVLAAVAINSGLRISTSARVKQATAEILVLQTRIDEYALATNSMPTSLADVGVVGQDDPWGRPYRYLSFVGVSLLGGKGVVDTNLPRKDRFLVPINTLYDLYSLGADGTSTRQLGDPVSQDDIIRANDGAFVGLASQF